jgi:alkylmercury lyase
MPNMMLDDSSHKREITETVKQLAARWASGDKQLLRQVFPLLALGKPLPISTIVEVSGSSRQKVEEALRLGRAGCDSDGQVIGLSGLVLTPTMHRIEIDGVTLFGCCAVLSQLAPSLVGKPATIESVDPVSRRVVKVTVTPEEITAIDPPEAVGSLIVTDPKGVNEDVAANFCSHVHHFSSAQSAGEFVAADSRRYVVEMRELHGTARLLHQEVWA